MKYSILFFLLLLLQTSYAQSAKEDLTRMYELYHGVKDIYLEVENKTYKGDKVMASQAAKIYKKGGSYLYEMGKVSMLVNKKYILLVNHESRMMVCNKWTKAKATELEKMAVPSMEDLLSKYPTVNYLGRSGGQKHYSFENSKQALSKIEVFFEQKTGAAKRTVYHRNPKLVKGDIKMELLIEKLELNPSFSAQTFSEKQFIQEQGGKLRPSSRYKNYTIHDYRKQ